MALLTMRGIDKRFGRVHANRAIDLSVESGRILGLLGENGSGKSTLMKILLGMVSPDAGSIAFKGRPLAGHAPRDAIAAGISMIHQHFMLIDAMSVAENVLLGAEREWLDLEGMAETVRTMSGRYGLDLDPAARVGDLPLGHKQRVAILKAILQGAELLVLDEPTSNLSPPEIEALAGVLKRLRDEGKAVIFISHKLHEVLDLCDEVAVLRDGALVGRCPTAGVDSTELGRMIVGRDIPPGPPKAAIAPGRDLLVADGLTARGSDGRLRLDQATFVLRAGEVLAVAGVDGNGQLELVEAIVGLLQAEGRLVLDGADATAWSVRRRQRAGLAYIPADRATTSLVQDMSVEENLALRDVAVAPFSCGGLLARRSLRGIAERRIGAFSIRASSAEAPVRSLSGGNQQKIALAREIDRRPKVLVAHQAAWGLDPGARQFVIEQVLALRASGSAVLYVSSELEEVLQVGDRVGVMLAGRLVADMKREQVDLSRLGLLMAGAEP